MTRRVVDIADSPVDLSVRDGLLVIASSGNETRVPLVDLAVLVVSHQAVRYTQAVLTGLCEAGGAFVLCDGRHMPVAMLEPLAAHYVHTQRLAAQVAASPPVKKRLWQGIVRAKLKAQGHVLRERTGEDHGLKIMAERVRSGDPSNVEAQASRRYWPLLFGPTFRRNPHAEDQNRHLNYGYAVVRAIVARAVCASGLHPSMGLNHHSKYDPFCLADDIMEPFRPTVDIAVAGLLDERGSAMPLDKEAKARIIGAIQHARFEVDSEMRSLFETVERACASLVEVYTGRRKKLCLPEF